MKCSVCSVVTKRRCGGCRQVYYCGSECQRMGWPAHRTVCGTQKPAESPQENAERRALGAWARSLPDQHPFRQRLSEFYSNKTPKEILLDMLMADPSYVRRKEELNRLLTPETVNKLLMRALRSEYQREKNSIGVLSPF